MPGYNYNNKKEEGMDNTNRLELKNQALLEKISSLTTNYENQVADLRVEITILSNELQSAQTELSAAVERLNKAEEISEVSEEAEDSE